ncbi:retrotransposon protein, putative, ty1-copia subclass [Tanacetum coccineum]
MLTVTLSGVSFRAKSVVVVRPVNTRHRWDETCLLDIIVIKSTDVVGPISHASPTDSEYLRSGMRYMIHNEVACLMLGKLSVGLILNGLTTISITWGRQLVNYMLCSLSMKKGLPKKAETPQVLMIRGGKIQKANKKSLNAKGNNKVKGKGKDKKVYIPKNPKPTAMERPTKDDACHHCKEVKHWKRNCHVYLAELLKKKKQVGSTSSSGALYLYVGNEVRAQVEAIGSFELVLPNGLVICLDNCHYAPTITRGVLVSHLVDNGFVKCFTDYGISVSKNDVLYFNVIARNGIYEIDMHVLLYPNGIISIYMLAQKESGITWSLLILWNASDHINKNLLNQLQQEGGCLKSTDDESFDKYESCCIWQMTKKPFPH